MTRRLRTFVQLFSHSTRRALMSHKYPVIGHIVIFGGLDGSTVLGDMWQLNPE